MRKILNLFALLLVTTLVVGQEKEKAFKIELHGFVGVNAFYDTRQSVIPRNGNIFLWPKRPELDKNGEDINDHGRFDVDAAFSRFGLHISGPEVFGAKSFALLEGDFLGKSGASDLNFRLRHAFIRLNWGKTSLLAGQTWHPVFLAENYPTTVNLNSGSPFHPLNRSPQIRLSYQLSNQLEVTAYLLSQNDFVDAGLAEAMENSLVPEIDAQIKYKTQSGTLAAFTIGYKTLKPNLTDEGYKTTSQVESFHMSASFKKKFNTFTFKTGGLYGGNMTNLVMIGGVARKAKSDNPLDMADYITLKSMSVWTDIHSNGKKVEPGFMFGYSQNLGASEEAEVIPEYSLGADIGHVFAISPRIKFYATSNICLGFEWLHTVAAYGGKTDDDGNATATYDSKGKPTNLFSVTNNRFITSLRYTF